MILWIDIMVIPQVEIGERQRWKNNLKQGAGSGTYIEDVTG